MALMVSPARHREGGERKWNEVSFHIHLVVASWLQGFSSELRVCDVISYEIYHTNFNKPDLETLKSSGYQKAWAGSSL